MTKNDASTLLEGSSLLRMGRADVISQQERTKLKRLLRAVVVFVLIDLYLWHRFSSGNLIRLPGMPHDWMLFLPAVLLVFAILLMVCLPLISGRSPHITVYPDQVEVGLGEIKGLRTQVDEVVRTLDVFLGYRAFRDELGGTPRRGMLFEGPPGTGKTYLAKAMSKQAGVPFLFISAPSLQSMWQGMTAYRIRSFFKALRKAARKQGGAIGFIEEIDAIGLDRSGLRTAPSPSPRGMSRITSNMMGGGDTGGMVNELLIQMQSFDLPPVRDRIRAKFLGWINGYLPSDRQIKAMKTRYNNILLIAATNRADFLDQALLRPGRFDRRLFFDLPTKAERDDLIEFFLDRKRHHDQLDDPKLRDRLAHETFGYTPVMIEHLFDEALLVSLREGRKWMNYEDVLEAKYTEEIGVKQAVEYAETDRESVATHEAGHAVVAHVLGIGRRLEVLSIIKRRGSLGLLAHGDSEERFTRTRTEIEAAVAIALGGLVAEEMCFGESGTGPANDLAFATDLAAKMVGAFGMAGSLISYDAVAQGALSAGNLVSKVLGDPEGKARVEDILGVQKERVRAVLEENRDVHTALRDALMSRDELVGEEILDVIEKAISNRA